MGGCCTKWCPTSTSANQEPSEQQRLLSPSPSFDVGQAAYGSVTPPNLETGEQLSDRDTVVRDIIKVVESRVVDTGAVESNMMGNQERADYYATLAEKPIGLTALQVPLARTYGDPVTVIGAPTVNPEELHSARLIAQAHGDIVQTMYRQQHPENLVVPFDQAC